MSPHASKAKAKAPLDRRDDLALLRHVRLVKPHLAPTGFKTDKWDTIAAAVNREVRYKAWRSGSAARGRYGHLLKAYRENKRSLGKPLRERIEEYAALLEKRGHTGQTVRVKVHDAVKMEEGGEVTEFDRHQQESEEEEEEEELDIEDAGEMTKATEVVETKYQRPSLDRDEYRELVDTEMDQFANDGAAQTVAEFGALIHETVSALRTMTNTLLKVIADDHALRRAEVERNSEARKELLAIVRLALQHQRHQ